MPIVIDAQGNEVEEDSGQVVNPAQPSPDDKVAQDFGHEDATAWKAENVGELAALAANSATMGAVPFLTGLVSSEKKNEMLNYLEKGREHNPTAGVAAEIGGALAMPIPGMGLTAGLAKGAGTAAKLMRLGKVAGKGAAIGAGGAALGYSGNVGGGSWDAKDFATATATGAGLGAVGGVAADKLGRTLAARAKAARFSAGGGTAGSIRKLGASGPGATESAINLKASKVAKTAEREGWIGKAGQTTADSADKAAASVGVAEKRMQDIIKQHGTHQVPAADVVADMEAYLTTELARSKGGNAQLSKANKESITTILDNVKESLGYKPKTVSKVLGANEQPVVKAASWSTPHLKVEDVQNLKGNLRDMVWGPLGTNVPANSVAKQAQAKAAMYLSEFENGLIAKSSKNAAANFKEAKELMHHAKLWESMGRKSVTAERGLLELGTGRGLRSIPDTAVVHTLLAPIRHLTGGLMGGPISSQVLAGSLMGSGQNANNLLAASKAMSRMRSGTGKGWSEKALSTALKRGKPTLRMGQALGVGSSRND